MELVGTNEGLMNMSRIRTSLNAPAPSVVLASRPKKMANHVVESVNNSRIPAKTNHPITPACDLKPIANATKKTSKDEKRLDTVDDATCPPRIDDGATGIVLKRLMMPLCTSMLRRIAAYEMPLMNVMTTRPGTMKLM